MKNANFDFSTALKSICPFCGGDRFRGTKEKSYIQCVKCLRLVFTGSLKTEHFKN